MRSSMSCSGSRLEPSRCEFAEGETGQSFTVWVDPRAISELVAMRVPCSESGFLPASRTNFEFLAVFI